MTSLVVVCGTENMYFCTVVLFGFKVGITKKSEWSREFIFGYNVTILQTKEMIFCFHHDKEPS
jgi:hypothetical protein